MQNDKSKPGSLLIKGGHLIDPAAKINAAMDILLRDGRVAEIALPNKVRGGADEKFDARGLIVAPGFIDLHVHLREPGQSYKETIASGTAGDGFFVALSGLAEVNVQIDESRSDDQTAGIKLFIGTATDLVRQGNLSDAPIAQKNVHGRVDLRRRVNQVAAF